MEIKRHDGRTLDELRKVELVTGFTKFAEGSCLITCGDTMVLCNASVEEKVPQHVKYGGWITAEYSMLPRANRERSRRDVSKLKLSPRSAEIQRLIGRSLVIGKPVALMLIAGNATVTVCHTKTADLKAECKAADIIVAAAGKAKMITADYVREGQIVIDVGMNVDENGKLCGDVDFAGVSEIVDAITPVPRGVGSVTTSVLLANTVTNASRALF